MKKRLLSMLLLVVMLVTALPLGVLTVFAEDGADATEPVFTLEDYNNLYVQEGLVFALDFYQYNEHWGHEIPAIGLSPAEEYGKEEDSEKPRFTFKDGVATGFTPEFSDAVTTWVGTTLPNYLNGMAHKAARKLAVDCPKIVFGESSRDPDGDKQIAFFSVKAGGYMELLPPHSYRLLTKELAGLSGTGTLQLVMAQVDQVDNRQGVFFREVGIDFTSVSETETVFQKIGRSNGGNVTNLSTVQLDKTFPIGFGDAYTMTWEQNRSSTLNAAGTGYDIANRVWINDTSLTGEAPAVNVDTDAAGQHYIGFTGSTQNFYAIRYYDGTFDADKMAQNHFADLAKFYKVDLTGFSGIDEAFRPDVYAAVADVRIGDAGAAEAVRKAIVDGVNATYSVLKIEIEPERNAFIDVAAGLLADIDLVVKVVSSARPMMPVYEAVVANHAAAAYTKATFEADVLELYTAQYFYDVYKGLDADLNAFLDYAKTEGLSIEELMSIPYDDRVAFAAANKGENGDFAGVTQATVDDYAALVLARYADFLPDEYDYDSLYVQEGLVFALDFYQYNEHWKQYNEDHEEELPVAPISPKDQFGTAIDSDPPRYIFNENGEAADFHADFETAVDTWKNRDVPQYLREIASVYDPARTLAYKNTDMEWNTSATHRDGTGEYQYPSFTVKEGYMEVRRHRGNAYINAEALIPKTGKGTLQCVLAQEDRVDAMVGIFFRDAGISHSAITETETTFDVVGKINGYGIQNKVTLKKNVPVGLGDAYTLTWEQDRPTNAGTSTTPDIMYNRLWADGISLTGDTPVEIKDTDTVGYRMIGYSGSTVNYYAIRYYDCDFSEEKIAQNHFADVAKYFRLDLSTFDRLSADQRAAVYRKFADVRLSCDLSRKEIQERYDETVGECYYDALSLTLTNDPDLNRQFLALAKLVGLDIAPLEGVDPDTFEPLARDIVARFDPALAQNKAVVAEYTDKALKPYGAVTFAGYQVRVDSGVAAANRAGVRAVFDVNTELLKELSAKGAITFGARIYAAGAAESNAELRFTYNADTAEIVGSLNVTDKDPVAVGVYERTTVDGRTVTSFNYSVVFSAEELTVQNLNREVVYKYYVTVGDVSYDLTAQSARFGEQVSAAEVYRHFATLDKYASDRMVAEVLRVLDGE